MAPLAQQIANMVDMLPETDQIFTLEFVKKLVRAWDPDFTKLTPAEQAGLEQAESEMDAGAYVLDSNINWG